MTHPEDDETILRLNRDFFFGVERIRDYRARAILFSLMYYQTLPSLKTKEARELHDDLIHLFAEASDETIEAIALLLVEKNTPLVQEIEHVLVLNNIEPSEEARIYFTCCHFSELRKMAQEGQDPRWW